MSRIAITAWSEEESMYRVSSCWCGGKKDRIRLIVCAASVVWSVVSTRCPVSAAMSAVCMVSPSRTSPIRITSGSCRRMCFRPSPKEAVSRPTSRCEIVLFLSR